MPRNKEKYNAYMAEYMLKRYHKRRDYIFSQLGSSCRRCGSEDGLQVDHIDASTKLFPVAKMWSVNWTLFVAEVAKCQVLCQPCHHKKSLEYGDYTWKRKSGSNPGLLT